MALASYFLCLISLILSKSQFRVLSPRSVLSPMPSQSQACCKCNGKTGVCVKCSCAKKGVACINCMPSLHGNCSNSTSQRTKATILLSQPKLNSKAIPTTFGERPICSPLVNTITDLSDYTNRLATIINEFKCRLLPHVPKLLRTQVCDAYCKILNSICSAHKIWTIGCVFTFLLFVL